MIGKIEIPETREYGYILSPKGDMVFTPSKKAYWNRVRYIVEKRGGTLIERTTSFEVEGGDFSQEDYDLLTREGEGLKSQIVPKGITLSEEGREEPNFDNE